MYNISEITNKILCGDAIFELKKLPSDSIDCVITSPPYNKGFYGKHTPSKHDVWKQRNIEYGDFKDDLDPEQYIKQQTEVLTELVRIIKPAGSIFYNHKLQVSNHRAIFPEYIFKFNLRQIIIWDRGSTPQLAPIRFLPTTEYVFWITKTNIQPKFYRRGQFDKDVWRIPPKPMLEHPAPFPEELVNQCVLSTTDENDLVVDCFAGSGTVGVVAKRSKRNYILIELNPKYIEIAQKRISEIPKPLL